MKLLTTKQLAELLQVNPRKIYQLVAEHKIPFVKIGSSVRFNSDSITEWIEAQEIN